MTGVLEKTARSETESDEQTKINDIQPNTREVDIRWLSKQLLPDTFQRRRRAQDVLYGWSFILFTLVAFLCGLTSFYLIRGRQTRSERAQLIASAQPIEEMKKEAERLEHQNVLHNDWASQIESTQADDSLLQALLSIAQATDASNRAIDVKSVDVKLELENANPVDTPLWARSRFAIVAELDSRTGAENW